MHIADAYIWLKVNCHQPSCEDKLLDEDIPSLISIEGGMSASVWITETIRINVEAFHV